MNCEYRCKPCDGDCPPEFTEADVARMFRAFQLQDVDTEVPLLHRLIRFVRARTLDSLKEE